MNDVHEARAREEDLRSAMLAGDASAPSDLIDDRAVFTGPDDSVLDDEMGYLGYGAGAAIGAITFESKPFTPSKTPTGINLIGCLRH
jgi:hypothetical protein